MKLALVILAALALAGCLQQTEEATSMLASLTITPAPTTSPTATPTPTVVVEAMPSMPYLEKSQPTPTPRTIQPKPVQEASDLDLLLFQAVKNEDLPQVKRLLRIGANANASDEHGQKPLHWASLNGRNDIILLLLEKGASAKPRNFEGMQPVHWAAGTRVGNSSTLKLLVKRGASVNATDFNGATPLHFAPLRGKQDVVLFLIEKGADVNAQDVANRTPLHSAAFGGSKKIVEMLLENGADVRKKDAEGKKAFEYSANDDVLEVLILAEQKNA
ncbi:MAG: ankyrin repeat domain-containing protein [Candidatus Micrarchaeia archaeon]